MNGSIGPEGSLSQRLAPSTAKIALVGSLGALIVAGCLKSEFLKLVVSALAGPLMVWALVRIFRSTDFSVPPLGNGTPRQLAWIRIIVCLIAFILTVIESLPAVSWRPVEFQLTTQPFAFLSALPGYQAFVANPHLLAIFQWITAILLLLAMVGMWTRVTLPLAAICFLVFEAILRQYTYFFHAGLVPLYLLLLLPWTPCAAAWSIDRRLNPAKTEPNRQSLAFSVYACLIVISVVYALCGLSKLTSGLDWFRPENMQHKLLRDAMNPIFLDYQWKPAIWLVQHDAPGFVYTTIAILGTAIEASYFTVLFSRTARIVLPLLAVGLHMAILILQHLLFLDVLILQAIFLNADKLAVFTQRHFRLGSIPASGSGAEGGTLRRSALVSMAICVVGLFMFWVFRIEYYPFSSWGMYASVEGNTPVYYARMVATLEDGRSVVVPRRDYSPAVMPNSFSILQKAFYSPWSRGSFDRFLSAYVERRNRNLAFGSPISAIQIQLWRWNYAVDPHDPRFGWITHVHDYDAVARSNAGGSIQP